MTLKAGVLYFRLDAYLDEITAETRQHRDGRVVPRKTDLAESAGVHLTTLSRWSSGEIHKLDLHKICAMLDTLNKSGFSATPNDLLYYEPPQKE